MNLHIKTCRCCGSKKLMTYLNLGDQPFANSYHLGEQNKKFPLEVTLCKNCFHSQLTVVINPKLLFKNYLYVSGTTDTFKKHCEELAIDAVNRFKSANLSVLDIGCNDGLQLEYFRKLGCRIMGVDPAENLRSITKSKKIPVIVDYWSLKTAKKIKIKFDIVTGTNVFAHVNNVRDFLLGAKYVLNDNGIIILEFPYAKNMIINNEFDTIYHEHLSYFLVNSFKTLISRVGMKIIDVAETPIHGGSIRFFLSKNKEISETKKIVNLIEDEKKENLLKIATYKNFSKRVAENKEKMRSLIKSLRQKRVKIIGYGASAKGNTMLNYFKIKLDYIVDDNELKWNLLTPGANIPIKNPKEIKNEKKDLTVVILAWNFFNEIAKKILLIRGNSHKDRGILYVPTVKIMDINENSKMKLSA